ncbi:hypothetical protein [Sphingobacterium siyangense]|uniref:hypothetical protein n=1 Tax=Sphingobacterium siyangense TaxID=459529 RepID=UPI003DA6B288
MKNVIILFFWLLTSLVSIGQVRKTKWGMTKQQVISAEGVKPSLNRENGLGFNVKLAGFDNYLFYFFNSDGKLSAAAYNLSEKFASDNSYLNAFFDLTSKLKEKYGEGTPKIEWQDELYRNDKKKWGIAIAAEHLVLSNRWETDDTIIVAEISGKNYEISVSIRYSSKNIPYKKGRNDLDDL